MGKKVYTFEETKMKKIMKAVLGISFVLYICVLIVILFFRPSRDAFDLSFLEYIRYSINIVPFRTIGTYVKAIFNGSMNLDIPLKNLGGNLILFLPMGVYIPFLIKKMNSIKLYFIFIISLIFFVEIIQLLTKRGSFDIDDLILNIIGAFIGFAIWKTKFIQKLIKKVK